MTKAEQVAGALPNGIDAALVLSPHNRRYLTGFKSSEGAVLITRGQSYFLTDFRYIEAARRVVTGMECAVYDNLRETLRSLRTGMTCAASRLRADGLPVQGLIPEVGARTGRA